MQELRDSFLLAIIERFPQLDLEEVYEILNEFKQPFIALTQQMDGENEYSVVTLPWNFERLRALQLERSAASNNQIQMQQSLPNMARLSLEEKKDAQVSNPHQHNTTNGTVMQQSETDRDMIFSTQDTSA